MRNLYVLYLLLFGHWVFAQSNPNKQPQIHSGVVVVKLKSNTTSNSRTTYSPSQQLTEIKKLVNAESSRQVFPDVTLSNARSAASGLQNIYKLTLPQNANIWKTIAKIRNSGLVEYAEPLYQDELLYTPNDPEANPNGGKQDYLAVIRAYEAWDVERSDTSMVVGIVDTGVNMDHEDLHNIAYNHADPINGIDDDGDGYIDNYLGWDISDDDNNPTADGHQHGTPVTGMSSAKTNNGIGMAGTGFNARFLPVKIAQTSTQKLFRTYEGVRYAADHGARVINLSWGGAGNYSRYGQDIINYAVLEKDAVVVAAAGNTNEELDFYPASFNNVLSVGATDINDNKASWATYSYFIDMMAPGNDVFTTKNDGGYEITFGTSFSSPLVAGAAALVRSRFPELNAIQVMEQLRVTSDVIYEVGNNQDYNGKLGKGRLNMYRALTDVLTPSVRLSDSEYASNHDQLVFAGDTVHVLLEFTNYLRSAENLTISVSCVTKNVVLQTSELYVSSLETLESISNEHQPLSFIVNGDVMPGDRLFFRIDFLGNYYEDFEYFEIPLTPDYFDISDGMIASTISSDGDIGFNDDDFREGNGITFNGSLICSNSGMIISQGQDHVMNNIINNFGNFSRDQDFMDEQSIKLYDNSIANYDARSVYKPHDTLTSQLPIRIEQKVMAWDHSNENGYLIFEYRLINFGDTTLTNLNAGMFADWDLGDHESNAAATDLELDLGYIYNKSSKDQYAGLALISGQEFTNYAIDLFNINGNISDFDTVFSDSIKHHMISSGTTKHKAGMEGNGNDVAQILGAKNFDLLPNEAKKVVIVMLAAPSLDDLKSALSNAKEKYALYQQIPPRGETFYACLGDSALVDPVGKIFEFYSDLALTHRLDSGSMYKSAPVLADTFVYAINLDSGYQSQVMRLPIKPGNPLSDFNILPDTLLIENGSSGEIQLENKSQLASAWEWNFDNGYSSTLQDPATSYQSTGSFTIELIASNHYGCTDTLSKPLLVVVRLERPEISKQHICKHTSASIAASNTDIIRIYNDSQLENMIFEGKNYITKPMVQDTIFYVTNHAGDYESVAVPVYIEVNHPETGIQYTLDTMDLSNKYALAIANSNGPNDSISWYIDKSLVSRDSSFQHVYSENPFQISQVKIDNDGCVDTMNIIIEPAYSDMPVGKQKDVCPKTPFSVEPEGGRIFHFYADEAMTQLVHKGKSYSSAGADQDMTYYVTNVDQLLESASASYEIKVNPLEARISVGSDSILLEEASQVELIDASLYADISYWLNPTGTFDTSSVRLESYKEPGTYSYELVAVGGNECTDTTRQKITVYTITSLHKQTTPSIKLYPNPATSELILTFVEPVQSPVTMRLVNASGQKLEVFNLNQGESLQIVNLRSLPSGIYFIQIHSEGKINSYKILKH